MRLENSGRNMPKPARSIKEAKKSKKVNQAKKAKKTKKTRIQKLKEVISVRKIKALAKKLTIVSDKNNKNNEFSLPRLNNGNTVNISRINKLIDIDYPHFSSVLPYRYYWKEKKLFINERSLGFGLELTVFSGADEKLINSISDLLRHKISDDLDVQFVLWGSNQVGEIIDNAYSPLLANNNIFSELAKNSIQYYKKAAVLGFKNKLGLPIGLREYRLFVFLSKNTPYTDEAVVKIENARDDLIAELESTDIGHIELTLPTFLTILRSWINPNPQNIYRSNGHNEKHTTLNEQIVDKSFELINEEDRVTIEIYPEDTEGFNDNEMPQNISVIKEREEPAETAENEENEKKEKGIKGETDEKNERNGKDRKNEKSNGSQKSYRIRTKITNLSIRTLPDEFALWQSPNNFFNVFRASQAIRCPFLISMHIRLIPSQEAKSKAQNTYLSMSKKANSIYAKYISGTQETAAEWKKIRDELASDEIRLAWSYFNLVLFSKEGEEKHDESAAISCYRYNRIELCNTKYMQLQSFLATLPFVMSEGMFFDLKKSGRLKTLTTWNLANLLPIVADFKLGRQGVPLTSFRNQICFFDMYSSYLPTANYNVAVAATSGAGKSFFVQNIINYVLSINGRCFVIDLGQSYRKFCEIVGGTYLEYGSLNLNPFTNLHNINESSEQIGDLLSVLASPSGSLDDVQEEYLRQAVISSWYKKKNATNIDDIILSLTELDDKQKDIRIHDLITLLSRYSTTGPYPKIFNDYSKIAAEAKETQKNKLIVLELGELENKPDLLKAVLFALILNIEEQIYQSPRNQPKVVVIDEAWRLLSGDNKAAARFIEKGYRTARRHFGSFITITQSIDDFQKSDEAKACWNCSDIKAIMLQNSKAFEDFMLGHKDYFDPYTVSLIKQFREARNNGFSELMLQTGKIQSFCRLFVDPFSRVMFSSAGNEFSAVKKYQEQGLSITESILRVAKENYPDEW